MPKPMNFINSTAKPKKVLEITSFAGIDLSSSKADVDKKRSPNAPNMMPDSHGNPIKRNGYEILQNYGARINGCFNFAGKRIVHAGTMLFANGELLREGLNDFVSSAQVVKDKLYIFDGKEALCFDGERAIPLWENAYIPTVLISKKADDAKRESFFTGDGETAEFLLEDIPKYVCAVTVDGAAASFDYENGKITLASIPADGAKIEIDAIFAQEPGGSVKEEFNLISNRWRESFFCDTGTEVNFTLSKTNLSSGAVKAWMMDEKGAWHEMFEERDFAVNREAGKVVFYGAVFKAAVEGEDNLVIEAEKDFFENRNKINLCSKSIVFDSNGAFTRIFLCGNPNEPEKDFWCAAGDPSYFPDNYYSELCARGSAVVGYSVINGELGTHIAPAPDGRSIVMRKAQLDENGNTFFTVTRHLQGEEAAAKNSFVYMEKEPLFLTKRGVYAVTAEDISGEKYTQNRSFYINKALCEDPNLENAFCAKWKQFYLIALPGKVYLLDTSQKSFERGEPLSSFQYECYLWKGFDARIVWEEDGELFFGDNQGNICRFKENLYADNGKAIEAFWTVPDFAGSDFWRNKTIRTVAVEAEAYPLNKVRLEYKKEGKWVLLKEWRDKLSFFAWNSLSWKDFTWSGNAEPRTLAFKTKIKNCDKVGFRIACSEKDKAFGLCGFAVEFTEGGRFKR